MDVARRLGAPTVKLWPGQDGFDYPLQADYRELWRLALEGVRTVAAMDDDIRVAIEYKTKEPRTHMSLSTAARTLVGIAVVGRDDIGIVVDLGHSLFAKEAPADVLQLSTSTAACSPSRSTTTGASGTTTSPSARST